MKELIKILIDPCYVTYYPFRLIPRILAGRGWPLPSFLKRLQPADKGFFVNRFYGPGRFDGMDLGFTYTGLLDSDLNLNERILEHYCKKGWPIHAFHATFGGGAQFFADTQMELTEDTERTRRGLRNQVLAAKELKTHSAILVLHLGKTTNAPHKALQEALRVIDSVLPLAEHYGVILALENMPCGPPGRYYLGADYRELKQAIDLLKSPFVKVCLDLGHANNYSRIFAKDNPREPVDEYVRTFGYCREIISELGPDIVYSHIHYNRSHTLGDAEFYEEYDEHMPLSRIPEQERGVFNEVISLLLRTTSVPEVGLLNLELIPGKFFGFLKIFPNGSTEGEQLESVRLLREMVMASQKDQ